MWCPHLAAGAFFRLKCHPRRRRFFVDFADLADFFDLMDLTDLASSTDLADVADLTDLGEPKASQVKITLV